MTGDAETLRKHLTQIMLQRDEARLASLLLVQGPIQDKALKALYDAEAVLSHLRRP